LTLYIYLAQNRERSEPLEKWVVELGEGVHNREVFGIAYVPSALNALGLLRVFLPRLLGISFFFFFFILKSPCILDVNKGTKNLKRVQKSINSTRE
jgi:hypothetical protein